MKDQMIPYCVHGRSIYRPCVSCAIVRLRQNREKVEINTKDLKRKPSTSDVLLTVIGG